MKHNDKQQAKKLKRKQELETEHFFKTQDSFK